MIGRANRIDRAIERTLDVLFVLSAVAGAAVLAAVVFAVSYMYAIEALQ